MNHNYDYIILIMSKRILITGSSGLVGKALVKSLLDQGYLINILTTQKKSINKHENVNSFFWNPLKNQIDLQSLENVECIINLAGAPIAQRWTKKAKEIITNSRVMSLQLLAHTIKTHNFPINHLISASAIGVYANSMTHYYEEKDTAFNSNSFLSSVVRKWEVAARIFDSENFKTSILRIGIVLDKNEGALPKLIFPVRNFLGAFFGSGNQWQSWIHIDDLVSIFSYIINQEIGGVFNAVAPNPVRQSELVTKIASVLKKPLFLPKIPEYLLKLFLGDMSAIILESQRVCSKKIQQSGFKFKFHEIGPALENILRS